MHQGEFDELFTNYYQIGSVEKVVEALDFFVNTEPLDRVTGQPKGGISHYFFASLANEHPSLLRTYEAAFDTAPQKGKIFILWVLALCGDEKTRAFLTDRLNNTPKGDLHQRMTKVIERVPVKEFIHALQRPIESGLDLDLLWIEFIITGNTQAVSRIINVLNWRDLIRERLEHWLASHTGRGFLGRTESYRTKTLRRLAELTGIDCDPVEGTVTTVEDLDCLCSLDDLQLSREKYQPVCAALPFSLSREDQVNHIVIKATAKWSLASHAQKHKLVLDTCEAAIADAQTRTKLSLLEICAAGKAAHHGSEAEAESLQRILEIDPSNRRFSQRLKQFQSEPTMEEIQAAIRKTISDHGEVGHEMDDIGQLKGSQQTFRPAQDASDQREEVYNYVPDDLPARALIKGVPYFSYEEASNWEYPDSNITNASYPATMAMIGGYWGLEPPNLLVGSGPNPPNLLVESGPNDSWRRESGIAANIDVLKQFICRGLPVFPVNTAFTPYAHRVTHEFAELTGHQFENEGPFSGALGRMLSLQKIRDSEEKPIRHRMPGVSLRESVFMSSRVLIGYDDGRGSVLLHDPTFGATWEVGYKDFIAMWEVGGKHFSVVYPPNHAEIVEKQSAGPPYPERTSDDEAAVLFATSYALSSSGRAKEGEALLRQGLQMTDMEENFRYLFLFELATHCAATGRTDEAIELAEQATNLYSRHDAPWVLLAALYKRKQTHHRGFTGKWREIRKARDPESIEGKLFNSTANASRYGPKTNEGSSVYAFLPRRFQYDNFLYGLRAMGIVEGPLFEFG